MPKAVQSCGSQCERTPAHSAEPQAFRPTISVMKSNAMQPTFIQSRELRVALIAACALLATLPSAAQSASTPAKQIEVSAVYFPTHPYGAFFEVADTPRGATELVSYVYKPKGRGPFPAVVMMHGRGGPYSSNVNAACTFVRRGELTDCNAKTLSKRAQMWGEFWAQNGVLAIHVDSFGPRGRAHGFGRGTHGDADREAVNELTVRPWDAEDALGYLYQRGDVKPGRVALQGWSHGASTTLNLMNLYKTRKTRMQGFQQALVFYPGCGPKALLSNTAYEAHVPITVFLASDDEEVNPEACRKALTGARADLGNGKRTVEIINYDGATHDFDDPGKSRQSVPANVQAKTDAMARALRIVRAMAAK
jgi:dienelactone hydrolase